MEKNVPAKVTTVLSHQGTSFLAYMFHKLETDHQIIVPATTITSLCAVWGVESKFSFPFASSRLVSSQSKGMAGYVGTLK